MNDEAQPQRRGTEERFDEVSGRVAEGVGHPTAFILALLAVVIWAIAGPFFHFSDSWQLVMTTGTTVLTFLMVFLIQNSLNRDSMALHLKIDELIRVTSEATDALIGSERLPKKQIRTLDGRDMRVEEKAQPESG